MAATDTWRRSTRRARSTRRTVICVLTHDPKFDVPLLEVALRLPEVGYVGAMGSRRTHDDRLERLREAGLTEAELARLHSPIGLDLGARTPEETAVSIAAEIIARRWGGGGRPLTETDGRIHHETTSELSDQLNSILTRLRRPADTGRTAQRCEVGHMQVPGPFEYERATSVDHAVGLLDRLGDGALIVAGGHSLLPMMKLRIANPEYLVDINDLADELGYITVEPTLVRIGAMARHRQVLESDELAAVCPIFRDAERVIADPVVRNRGTIGGSLCQADPAEDLTTVNTVLDAVCLVRGPSGEREVPIDEFLEGPYETSLAFNEMLIEVRIPVRPRSSSAYAKVERRVGDWAVAAAGAAVTLDNGSIAAARVGLTAVNADAEATRGGRPSAGRQAADRGDVRRGGQRARRRPVNRSTTCAAAPNTSGTSRPN